MLNRGCKTIKRHLKSSVTSKEFVHNLKKLKYWIKIYFFFNISHHFQPGGTKRKSLIAVSRKRLCVPLQLKMKKKLRCKICLLAFIAIRQARHIQLKDIHIQFSSKHIQLSNTPIQLKDKPDIQPKQSKIKRILQRKQFRTKENY